MKRIDPLLFLVSRYIIMMFSVIAYVIGIFLLVSATTGIPKISKDEKESTDPRIMVSQTSVPLVSPTGVIIDTVITTEYKGPNGITMDVQMVSSQRKPAKIQSRVLHAFPAILFAFAIGFCLWHLSMLLKTLSHNEFFDHSNYRRLYFIGWTIISYHIIAMILGKISSGIYATPIKDSSRQNISWFPMEYTMLPEMVVRIPWILAGAVILLFAKAFRAGTILREEHDLQI